MASRAILEAEAGNLGIDHTLYPNDSKLRQKIKYEQKYGTETATGIKASGVYTASTVANGNTVTVGNKTYTFKTALTGVRATGVLTGTDVFSDGEEIVIGNKTYTMKTALTPTEGEVLIGASLAASLDNLKSAINHTGTPDTDYKCAAAHTQVRATTNTNTEQTVEALAIGTAGNALATTTDAANATWGAATLENGVNSVANEVLIGGSDAVALDNLKLAANGTAATEFSEEYSEGTVAHTQVDATTNTNSAQTFEAKNVGDYGNAIATTETGAGSFAAATLTGGTDSTVTSTKAFQISGAADV